MSSIETSVCFVILCYNEQRRIGECLTSFLADSNDFPIHVVVNGSTDQTARIARMFSARNVIVHEFAEGGKSRSWNRFVFDTLEAFPDIVIFVDGDTEIAPGSVAALRGALQSDDHAHLASALPLNGRRAAHYRAAMRKQRGVFGDLYAIRGRFLALMQAKGIRLPDDLIGDDGLIGAMTKTNLEDESHWDDTRIIISEGAGFFCDPVRITRLQTLVLQHRRMVNYSIRFFQNRIVSDIMKREGPSGLPRSLSSIYGNYIHYLVPRRSLLLRYYDRLACKRMLSPGRH